MSQANNRGVVNKRLRISSTGAFRQRENHSSSSSNNVAQSQSISSSGLAIDDQTELTTDLIKEQLDNVNDITTQPIIEVPTKRLLHLKELGGNLFVSSSTKIYSKTLQKLIDRVLFTKSLNNDVNTSPTDFHVFERVLSRSDDNDAYSTFTSLAPPNSSTILVLGSSSTEYALIWKLSQRRNWKIYSSIRNSLDQTSIILTKNFTNENEILNFIENKQIDLVISLTKKTYYEELEARLGEQNIHYLGCSVDTFALSEQILYAKQFMKKHQIPTFDWIHCLTKDDGEQFLDKYPQQEQWIIRLIKNNQFIPCLSRDDVRKYLQNLSKDQSFILEHGYQFEQYPICTLYIVSDGDEDYTQLAIIESDLSKTCAYGPCPYLTSKQLSYLRRRIVERTLRCSPTIRHLFAFRFVIQGTNYNDLYLLDYQSSFDEPDSEVVLFLTEPDYYLQYALDLSSITLNNRKRRMHCINTILRSTTKSSFKISNQIFQTAMKIYKVKIFVNQTEFNFENEKDFLLIHGDRICNILGYGLTLHDAYKQSKLAYEYIQQHLADEQFIFQNDIALKAIEWYDNHQQLNSSIDDFINGKFDLNDDDNDEYQSMDFNRAFGNHLDLSKIEHMNIDESNVYMNNGLNLFEGDTYFDLTKIDFKISNQSVLISSTINLNPLAALFNLNNADMNNNQNLFEYLGYELILRCTNDLICSQILFVQSCSLSLTTSIRSKQRFSQGLEQACQQLNCTLLKNTSISSSSSFICLTTGLINRECLLANNNHNLNINENDYLIGIRCSKGMINTQGYLQLKDLFQKKNIHLNDHLPFRNEHGDEESFISLLMQKTSKLNEKFHQIFENLILNRTIKVIRYLKDIGLARMIESLLGSSIGTLTADLNGQQWPTMPPIFTWIYQHSGFSQDEMFEYFNCGIDYLLIVDHTKISMDNFLEQFIIIDENIHCFSLGIFSSIQSTPTRTKTPIRLSQQAKIRTVQLKNILFKYPKPNLLLNNNNNTNSSMTIKDRMKQPIATDKTRCAVLISTNDTSLLSLLAYSTITIDCTFEIVLVLSTLASLSDIARVNELYPSVVTKVIQPKKYAARNYDLDQKIDDELQLHGCELVILDRYSCRLSPSFIQAWRGRLLNIYPSLLPAFRHSTSPIHDALQAGVRIIGVTVYFVDESDTDHNGPIIAQESISITPIENENQLENRLHILEQQVYPKAIDLVASGKIIYQGKKRLGKTNFAPTIASAVY